MTRITDDHLIAVGELLKKRFPNLTVEETIRLAFAIAAIFTPETR